MRKTELQAALLDVDGTLVDSNAAHAQSWVEAFDELGHAVTYERVRELIGKGGDKLLPETIGVQKDSDEGQRITRRRAAIFQKTYLPRLVPLPGARDLVLALRERGLRLVVASSASERELGPLLEAAGVDDLLPARTSSSDAESSKPDPDIVLAALARAGCAPREALMLGDTPYDVQAATRAGVGIVALRCGGWQDADLGGALAVYDDPRDLLRALDGSPFAA